MKNISVSGVVEGISFKVMEEMLLKLFPSSKLISRVKLDREEIELNDSKVELFVFGTEGEDYVINSIFKESDLDDASGIILTWVNELKDRGCSYFEFEYSEEDENGKVLGEEITISSQDIAT